MSSIEYETTVAEEIVNRYLNNEIDVKDIPKLEERGISKEAIKIALKKIAAVELQKSIDIINGGEERKTVLKGWSDEPEDEEEDYPEDDEDYPEEEEEDDYEDDDYDYVREPEQEPSSVELSADTPHETIMETVQKLISWVKRNNPSMDAKEFVNSKIGTYWKVENITMMNGLMCGVAMTEPHERGETTYQNGLKIRSL